MMAYGVRMQSQNQRTNAIKAEGGRRLNLYMTPGAACALIVLMARTGRTATDAVNAAVVAHEEATR